MLDFVQEGSQVIFGERQYERAFVAETVKRCTDGIRAVVVGNPDAVVDIICDVSSHTNASALDHIVHLERHVLLSLLFCSEDLDFGERGRQHGFDGGNVVSGRWSTARRKQKIRITNGQVTGSLQASAQMMQSPRSRRSADTSDKFYDGLIACVGQPTAAKFSALKKPVELFVDLQQKRKGRDRYEVIQILRDKSRFCRCILEPIRKCTKSPNQRLP
ncbi:hypothetical protein AC629_13335 [Bradyrhizobium sp. NAS80.1]|nr:hypothetical protein AC629_13335 [Bradyrhizobium sp. NAS80.1]